MLLELRSELAGLAAVAMRSTGRVECPGVSSGSCWVYRSDGYLITNHHVIEQADQLLIQFSSGHSMPARIVGSDAGSDLAVIKVQANDLPALDVRTEPAMVGEPCLAIGSPLDFAHSVSFGIISAVNRDERFGEGRLFDLVQTDAAINGGNSGGALIDMEGKVIGVPTWGMVVDPSSGVPVDNLSFALSGAMVSEMADTLIDQGGIDRPVLGLVLAERNASIAGVVTTALVIENVHAAQTSDIRPGDVVVKVNHQRTATRRELHRALAMKKVEGALPAEIYRDGSFLTVSIVPLSA